MSMIKVCPYCGQRHQLDAMQPPDQLLCGGCGRLFPSTAAIFTPPTPEPKLAPLDPRNPQSFQPTHRLLVEEENRNEPEISTSTALVAVGLLLGAILIVVGCAGVTVLLRVLRDQ